MSFFCELSSPTLIRYPETSAFTLSFWERERKKKDFIYTQVYMADNAWFLLFLTRVHFWTEFTWKKNISIKLKVTDLAGGIFSWALKPPRFFLSSSSLFNYFSSLLTDSPFQLIHKIRLHQYKTFWTLSSRWVFFSMPIGKLRVAQNETKRPVTNKLWPRNQNVHGVAKQYWKGKLFTYLEP